MLTSDVKEYLSDLVDILIVSFIFYQLLLLLRGTRAVQLVKGISVVVLLWIISRYFELRTVTWLIENLFSVGVIAIIVIFQPEVRRALEQIGRGGFFSRHRVIREEEVNQLVGEIAKAVQYFSSNHVGALIVLEQRTGLYDYIRTGVTLNADVSSELIRTVFATNTPLHDGAIIIQESKITAAGCFLPLSESTRISKSLGTRHRAGLGMSEISDAIVIIVSEESGVVSIAQNGLLETNLSNEAFLSHLFQLLKQKPVKLGKERGVQNG
ncbi:diadenylate cyclase CdaA [Shimazuella sp. AN120528]|uniref:diadenylate cyclase CdaA n=1 Tax=Shimazuella soli TaxID=1892854 RepID=UPI001F11098F|nr:diadenylate cyclase CdaA [Shimazuella soli]MCH5585370.1 diadenylate cyclase CdaA [Shimazuella soli]